MGQSVTSDEDGDERQGSSSRERRSAAKVLVSAFDRSPEAVAGSQSLVSSLASSLVTESMV